MPRGIPNCDTCHQPMKRESGSWCCQNGCWGCGSCGRQGMRKEDHCGCWLCRCSELQPLDNTDCLNFAGEPCGKCGHTQGACNCSVECVAGCGFLHPVGFMCDYRPVPVVAFDDSEIPF